MSEKTAEVSVDLMAYVIATLRHMERNQRGIMDAIVSKYGPDVLAAHRIDRSWSDVAKETNRLLEAHPESAPILDALRPKGRR